MRNELYIRPHTHTHTHTHKNTHTHKLMNMQTLKTHTHTYTNTHPLTMTIIVDRIYLTSISLEQGHDCKIKMRNNILTEYYNSSHYTWKCVQLNIFSIIDETTWCIFNKASFHVVIPL